MATDMNATYKNALFFTSFSFPIGPLARRHRPAHPPQAFPFVLFCAAARAARGGYVPQPKPVPLGVNLRDPGLRVRDFSVTSATWAQMAFPLYRSLPPASMYMTVGTL